MDSAATLGRRAFLKLAVAGAAAALLPQPPSLAKALPRIASALPLPIPHAYVADAETWLSNRPAGFDLLLAPAHIAAGLIQRGSLQALAGPAGRAHDPDGAYTIPYRYQVGVLRDPASSTVASWAALLQPEGRVLWSGGSRLALGAALLARVHSPNDTHPGRLAQAGDDLARLALTPHTSTPLAIELLEVSAVDGAHLPVEGVPLIEYDWVIPTAGNVALARSFVQSLGPVPAAPKLPGLRLIPLMPLPEPARRQHAAIWTGLGHPAAV